MTRWRIVPVVGAVLVTAACGTRLPDSAFTPPPRAPSATATTPVGTATDVGVTGTTIRIGTIVSRTNFFDPRAFVGPSYGVRAYFDMVNAAGGVAGRRFELTSCDDQATGSANVECVRKLIDRDKVFALVGNAVLDYGGAPIVQQRGVPDIGSQPIDHAYLQYSHLWDVLGESYPRNGTVGFDGLLHNGTETYGYFKNRFPDVPLRAAVVSYNQSSSVAYGKALAAGLQLQGYRVLQLQVNFALPDFDSVAISIRRFGARYLYDALDRGGNERLCAAVDGNRVDLVAKVTTTQSWDANVRSDYADSPRCRNVLWAVGGTRNYEDMRYPPVAEFRRAMAQHGWNTATTMSEWALEGWAGAQWFVDAVRSCGTTVTRTCVEAYMARPESYDGHGLLLPRDFRVGVAHPPPRRACLNVARWSDAAFAGAGAGGWVTQVPDMATNCLVAPMLTYRP